MRREDQFFSLNFLSFLTSRNEYRPTSNTVWPTHPLYVRSSSHALISSYTSAMILNAFLLLHNLLLIYPTVYSHFTDKDLHNCLQVIYLITVRQKLSEARTLPQTLGVLDCYFFNLHKTIACTCEITEANCLEKESSRMCLFYIYGFHAYLLFYCLLLFQLLPSCLLLPLFHHYI